ncbi:organic cation [Stylonychia lemnae]|uniref:Organic cation n=1 Tax=Stylonychia lemnae TaxID=5949 RepID=A0A077ZRH5_STYLE|nr:organic cation [Stylonychia lemnae]|eukprot:CDW72064.1 organic cation [Stylonychia lemnae]
MKPHYECAATGSEEYHSCKREEFCGNSDVSWRIDYSKIETLNNWVQKLNLFCISDNQLGLIGSSFFIGAFIGSLIIPRLADVYGRKRPYLFGLCLYACTAFIYPFSTSLYLNYFLIFLGGISESGRYYVGFVYLQELMPQSHQTYIGLNIFMVHGFAKLWYDVYFYKISKNWIFMNYSSIIKAILCLISVHFILPESPRYLLSSNQNDKARESFRKIARFNGIKTDQSDIGDFELSDQNKRNSNGNHKESLINQEEQIEIVSKQENQNIKDNMLLDDQEISQSEQKEKLLQNQYLNPTIQPVKKVEKVQRLINEKIFRNNLLIMIFSWSTASFGFYLIPYFLSSINTLLHENRYNVFELAIASSISEILANVFCYVITSIFPNKKSLILSYILAFFGSMGFWVAKDTVLSSSNILYYVLFSKFGITVAFDVTYVIMGELFPTLLKATAFGICNVIARFITILAPRIALLPQPYPMLIFSFSCLIAGLLGLMLKPIY